MCYSKAWHAFTCRSYPMSYANFSSGGLSLGFQYFYSDSLLVLLQNFNGLFPTGSLVYFIAFCTQEVSDILVGDLQPEGFFPAYLYAGWPVPFSRLVVNSSSAAIATLSSLNAYINPCLRIFNSESFSLLLSSKAMN